jgi:hypothetical protein
MLFHGAGFGGQGYDRDTTKGVEMGFIQIIDYRSSRVEDMQGVEEEWIKATEGQRTARRSILCRDRNDPDRYVEVVFFDSYESAMQNSALPATAAFADKLAGLTEGPQTFRDLDVITDREL